MHENRKTLIRPARAALGQQRALQRLRLHKQFGKGRVPGIGGGMVNHRLKIGGQLNAPRAIAQIFQLHATDFPPVFQRYAHARLDAMRPLDEMRGGRGEGMAVFRAFIIRHGLAAQRPERPAVRITQVDEEAEIVLDHVAAPAVKL